MSSEDMGTCHLTLAPHPQLDTQPGWVVATTQPLHLLQKSEVPFPPIVPPAGAMAGRLRFLAVLNKGPLGTGSSLRTTYPVHPGATTVFPSLIKDNTGRGTVHSRGNHLPPPARGHCRTHRSPQRRLFLHNFHSSQEERRPSTYNKSERAQQVHPPSSLQDGGNSNVEGPHLSGGLYVQTRPQGYLFYGPHHSFSPEVSLLSVGEQNIPLQMPSIWALQRSSNIYKGNKTDCLFPQTERGKDGDITRRYVVSTSSEGEACGNQKPGPRPAGEPGLPSELQEVRTGASSTNQLLGLQDRFTLNGGQVTEGEGFSNHPRGLGTDYEGRGICATACSHDRDFLLYNPCSSTGPPALQRSSVTETPRSPVGQLQFSGSNVQGTSRGLRLVGPPSSEDERPAHQERSALSGDNNRCIPPGVGCTLPTPQYRKPLDTNRERSPH